jgi:NADPH-dependent ferric siderophore reductase
MPKIPKWIGDTMEAVFNGMVHPVVVSSVDYIGEQLKKVVFEGDFRKIKFAAGNVVEFRINDNEFRHYTLSGFDADAGTCEVLFYLHDRGKGSLWARCLGPGDRIKMIGPGGRIRYKSAEQHFLFGDEASVGAFQCLGALIRQNGQKSLSILELDRQHQDWVHLTGMPAVAVSKSYEDPGGSAIARLEEVFDSGQWEKDVVCYLTGRAKSVKAMRRFLLSKGVGSRNIQVEPYWAEGRTAL